MRAFHICNPFRTLMNHMQLHGLNFRLASGRINRQVWKKVLVLDEALFYSFWFEKGFVKYIR